MINIAREKIGKERTMEKKTVQEIEKFAIEIRLEIMKQLTEVGFGHVGGSLSIADLVAVLYDGAMKYDPKDPKWVDRDRLVVSKGHAGPALYAALALKGFFPMDWLMTLNKGGTKLPSHCDGNKTPGIDITTGSLGQGLSPAVGMAYSFKLDGKDNKVFAILGDGEIQEGQIWEATMAAGKYKLDNLYVFIDQNKYQVDGAIDDVMPMGDIASLFSNFGWNTQYANGHDVQALLDALDVAYAEKEKPCVIIIDTIKGCGYPDFEKMGAGCHHMDVPKELGEASIRYFEAQLSGKDS